MSLRVKKTLKFRQPVPRVLESRLPDPIPRLTSRARRHRSPIAVIPRYLSLSVSVANQYIPRDRKSPQKKNGRLFTRHLSHGPSGSLGNITIIMPDRGSWRGEYMNGTSGEWLAWDLPQKNGARSSLIKSGAQRSTSLHTKSWSRDRERSEYSTYLLSCI